MRVTGDTPELLSLLAGLVSDGASGAFERVNTKWPELALKHLLSTVDFAGAGAVLTLQTGPNAGTRYSFLVEPSNYAKTPLAEINSLIDQQYDSKPHALIAGDIANRFECVASPIDHFFSNPIGIAWAIGADCDALIPPITLFCSLTSLVLRANKFSSAIQQIGIPQWKTDMSPKAFGDSIVRRCKSAMGCEDVFMWLWDRNRTGLEVIASTTPVRLDMRAGEGIAGTIAQDSAAKIVNDFNDADEIKSINPLGAKHPKVVKDRGWRSGIFIPLDIGGEIVGILVGYSNRPRGINDVDAAIAHAFAQQFAAWYSQVQRVDELLLLKKKLAVLAPTISLSTTAMEQIHDARNYLTLVTNEINRIKDRQHQHFGGEYKNTSIYLASQKAQDFIDQTQKILNKIGTAANPQSARRERCNMHDLIEEILRAATRTSEVKIESKNAISTDCVIKCNANAIERVFTNIIANSVFFLSRDFKAATKTIVAAEDPVPKDDFVRITVRDNGPGIAPKDLGRVREYTYTTRQEQGMGFGLPIVDQIVAAHGGRLEITSELGAWTAVSVELPRAGKVVEVSYV